jgi:glycosyltransferase involved in cell wall biosynthesis
VDAAIGLSTDVTDLLRLTFGGEKIFSAQQGFGFDLASADDRKAKRTAFRELHGIPEAAPVIVTIGELSPIGGQRDVVLAASEAAKRLPDAFYVIAGNDPTADRRHRRELKRLAKVLGMEDRFRWFDEPADISDLIAAADLFASTAQTGKLSWPTLDAIAAGLPVITASDEGLLPARYVVPPHEPVELAKRIAAFLEDPKDARETALLLQAAVRERFSAQKMTDDVELVYRKVLEL